MEQRMIYDIRTTALAQRTLFSLTNVPISIWERYIQREREYRVIDDLVYEVIQNHGVMPNRYEDMDFVYFHITTSSNNCDSILRHGILDLNKSYMCPDSELRLFLDSNGVHIDIENGILSYNGNSYDIRFGACPRENTAEYKCWLIGRKFYYDYTTCGFLSVWKHSPYGGNVHRRPEILMDIDSLLKTDFSYEWQTTHSPYQVVAKVSGKDIVYDSDESQSDTEKVMNYMTKAYCTAFWEPTEEVLLLKNNVQIPTTNIIDVVPFRYWK